MVLPSILEEDLLWQLLEVEILSLSILTNLADDRLCRIWDVAQGQELAAIQLQSPGWSVKWHPSNGQVRILVEEFF